MAGRAVTTIAAVSMVLAVAPAVAGDILRGPNGQGDILRGPNPAPDILRGHDAPPGGGVDTRIDPALCRRLPVHRPGPGVEHVPGGDTVGGRPVPPADLPGMGGVVGGVPVQVPVTMDLLRRLGVPVPHAATGLPRGAEVGALTLDGNRVLFNGQPIGPAAEDQVYLLCGRGR